MEYVKKMNLKPVIDYRQFRFHKLNTPEFSHLKWLIFWPIFGILFWAFELFRPAEDCHVMYHPMDDLIPFCEIFVIPYMFWFVYLVGMYLYTLFYDIDTFRRLMKFTAITYTATLVVYLVYPTCQELRPIVFERDNFLTDFMAGFYRFDSNTNVCPSIHVIGSVAVCLAGLHAPKLQKIRWKLFFPVTAVLICMATVFLKQHSILDVLWALPICAAAYWIVWHNAGRRKHKNTNDYRQRKREIHQE
ncbi:MAG: phosphatase PAP2 family protein [Clostridia bacterium]|nr:phosphatase PAP2 family protein [Clostridia bacterium]